MKPQENARARQQGLRQETAFQIRQPRKISALRQLTAIFVALVWIPLASAHTGSIPPSLKDLRVPPVPGLLDGKRPIIVNKEKAIVLGKALFWDMAVGSDGIACASCHFHAGADARTKNQFGPSQAFTPASATARNAYDPNDPRGRNLSNYQLHSSDFPLHDPAKGELDADTASHNVVASSGTFSGNFVAVKPRGSARDECTPFTGENLDRTFRVGDIHTRRVEPRNAPTVINAVLFDRNFWDGRASYHFNGASVWGQNDPNAHIWVTGDSGLRRVKVALANASMASLATGPALSELEMSCKGRTWPDIGRKLLRRQPLAAQRVARTDSVLGPYRDASGKGLSTTYRDLIQQAFDERYWSVGRNKRLGTPSYSSERFNQAEANFAFFFGIAVQLYTETLISDDTRFDRSNIQLGAHGFYDENGVLTATELKGLDLFNEAHCIFCHSGPLFSSATNRITLRKDGTSTVRTMVKRQFTGDFRYRMTDEGYLNNGAVPTAHDPGLAASNAFGQPLAFAPLYLERLADPSAPEGNGEPLPLVRACEIAFNSANLFGYFTERMFGKGSLIADPAGTAGCPTNDFGVDLSFVPKPEVVAGLIADPENTKLAPSGHMFKVPQLYNIELTGPFMHDGGMSTLDQVVDHYMRGGNFQYFQGKGNPEIDQNFMFAFGANEEDRQAIIAFLKTLTDERVLYERAPFDHPQLIVPHGHPGDQKTTEGSATNASLARDMRLVVPAVGAAGMATPLKTFKEILEAVPE